MSTTPLRFDELPPDRQMQDDERGWGQTAPDDRRCQAAVTSITRSGGRLPRCSRAVGVRGEEFCYQHGGAQAPPLRGGRHG